MGHLDAIRSSDVTTEKLVLEAPISVPRSRNLPTRQLLNEDAFVSMLYLERRRAERSHKRFLLVLIDAKKCMGSQAKYRMVSQMGSALCEATRETDIIGWYVDGDILGVIATELGTAKNEAIQARLLAGIRGALEKTFGKEQLASITLSFYFFPEDKIGSNGDSSANITLYPDLSQRKKSKWFALTMKRAMDVCGSLLALLILSPLMAVIAITIKLSSKGPILFRQQRLGQGGQPFTFLKFRSMYVNNDSKIHQQYVQQFIAGQAAANNVDGKAPLFKIKDDPRVTRIGRFIRKTSLDELPQFWNVLVGEMSLVGPRPPLAYEYTAYDTWHRRRVLEIKPGLTGLWQVKGRSRTQFDEMVRLDIAYARSWSIWLDLKILAQTPLVVLNGDGAH